MRVKPRLWMTPGAGLDTLTLISRQPVPSASGERGKSITNRPFTARQTLALQSVRRRSFTDSFQLVVYTVPADRLNSVAMSPAAEVNRQRGGLSPP